MEITDNDILKQIRDDLRSINARQKTDELFSDTTKLMEKSDKRVEYSINQIQSSFDRIHDKVFNFNNILIGVYLVLGTFPNNFPILNIWTVTFPIINLVYLVCIDIRQMEIHRFASREQEWTSLEHNEYERKIKNQTTLSLFALIFSLIILVYLIIRLA